jgi:hypothetical protein
MAHAGFPHGLTISDKEIIEQISSDSDNTYRRLIIEISGQSIGEMSYKNKGVGIAEIGIKYASLIRKGKATGLNFLDC